MFTCFRVSFFREICKFPHRQILKSLILFLFYSDRIYTTKVTCNIPYYIGIILINIIFIVKKNQRSFLKSPNPVCYVISYYSNFLSYLFIKFSWYSSMDSALSVQLENSMWRIPLVTTTLEFMLILIVSWSTIKSMSFL